MNDLLFLCQRLPYPPNKGEKIRAYYMLKRLSHAYRIHLGCFVDDPEDWRHVDGLKDICAEVKALPLSRKRASLWAALHLLGSKSMTEIIYDQKPMHDWVAQVIATSQPQTVVVYSSAMAQYVKPEVAIPHYVLDFVDVDSDKWRQYAETSAWPMRWVYEREARTLLAFDRSEAMQAQACTFVSEPETSLFQSLAPEVSGKIHTLPNGVNSDDFAPGSYGTPYTGSGPHLVFTGTMNYWPNVDAVMWFAQEIFPQFLKLYPDATFSIVGSHPDSKVKELDGGARITVTGRVEDIRPYIACADVVVAPMRIARGIQNKVLEGMSMARPVVTTPQGIEGIDARIGEEVFVAERAEEFVEALKMSCEKNIADRIGAAARARILANYSWETVLAPLDDMLAL